MKLRDYLKDINEQIENNPKLLDLQVVASSDEEGNCYTPVYFKPSVGYFDENEFYNESEYSDFSIGVSSTNAICVN